MQPRDWIAIVGLVFTAVGGIGALYHLWAKSQFRNLRMEVEQMREEARTTQHRWEGHLREAGSVAQAIKDMREQMKVMAADIKTLLRNGRNRA